MQESQYMKTMSVGPRDSNHLAEAGLWIVDAGRNTRLVISVTSGGMNILMSPLTMGAVSVRPSELPSRQMLVPSP